MVSLLNLMVQISYDNVICYEFPRVMTNDFMTLGSKSWSTKAAGDSQFICSLFSELHVHVVSSHVHMFAYYPNQGSDSHRLEFESKTPYHSAGQTLCNIKCAWWKTTTHSFIFIT